MKATVTETVGDSFWVELEAESVEETALLVRMALNVKKSPASVETTAYRSGKVSSWIVLDALAQASGQIKRQGG